MRVKPLSTVLKCLNLLETVAERPSSVRISELARMIGESRATTYQRLHTLAEAGWLERLPDGSYRLSVRASHIGAAAMRQAGFEQRSQFILDELASDLGEAVSLVLLEQEKLVIALRAESQSILRADLQVGAELSFKDSASGIIWLAFGPQDLLERVKNAGHALPSKKSIAQAIDEKVSIGGGWENPARNISDCCPGFSFEWTMYRFTFYDQSGVQISTGRIPSRHAPGCVAVN